MKTIIFGDSFIGPFSLVDDNNIVIHKFKAATMKGLSKPKNSNRKQIINVIQKEEEKSNINCLIFNFGQVDLYFSYYYMRYVKQKIFEMEPIIKSYVEFITNLDCPGSNKIILAVYPSTLKDENIFGCLLMYGILTEEQIANIPEIEKKKVSNFKFRFKLYQKFNKLLAKYCKKNKLTYLSLDNFLLNKNNKLKSKYINPVSKYSIHLLWEPLIPLLLSKISKCQIKKKYTVKLKNTYHTFIKKKTKQILHKNKTKKKNN